MDFAEKLKKIQGDLTTEITFPQIDRPISCTFTKLKNLDAHVILYGYLLPVFQTVRNLLDNFDAADLANSMGVISVIAEIPKILPQKDFWNMAQMLLKNCLVGEKHEIRDLDSDEFLGQNPFYLYILVFHAVRVNFPFFGILPFLKKKESEKEKKI